jgi:hypothetical protein
MALPVYRRRGIMYADLPRVETASLKESARGFEAIDRRLDQLSSYIEREGTKQAKEAAIKYAIENPVTEQQIQQARDNESGVLSFLSAFTGGGGSVYRETLKEAQGITLSTQLEVDAISQLNTIKKAAFDGYRVVNGQKVAFGSDEALVEMKDMADGFFATISSFNLKEAQRFNASFAKKSNAVIKEIYNEDQKRYAQQAKTTVRRGLDDLEEELRFIYGSADEQLDWLPDAQRFATRDEMAEGAMNRMLRLTTMFNDTEGANQVLQVQRDAKMNAIVELGVGQYSKYTPSSLLHKIDNGELGEYQAMFDSLPIDDKKKVSKLLSERVTELDKREKEKKEKLKSSLENDKVLLKQTLREYGGVLPPEEKQDALTQMDIANQLMPGTYSDTFIAEVRSDSFGRSIASDSNMADYRNLIRSGDLTTTDIDRMEASGKISGSQQIELDNFLETFSRKDFSSANKTFLNRVQGIPGMSSKMYKRTYKAKAQRMFDEYRSQYPEMPAGDVANSVYTMIESDFDKDFIDDNKGLIYNNLSDIVFLLKPEHRKKTSEDLVDEWIFGNLSVENAFMAEDTLDDRTEINKLTSRKSRIKRIIDQINERLK